MILATEYLARAGIFRKMMSVPCSLFLSDSLSGEKKAVTIRPCYSCDKIMVVKHWSLTTCDPEQHLPPFDEYLVPLSGIFNDCRVVLPGHRLLNIVETTIPLQHNSVTSPMPAEIYNNNVNGYLEFVPHKNKKAAWLWRQFVAVYSPTLYAITSDMSWGAQHSQQQDIVENMDPERWSRWLKWRRHLLDFSGLPGELAFLREYLFLS